jgi:hypothetical protein
MKSLEVKPGPWSEQKKKERAVPAALTEERTGFRVGDNC